MNESEIPIDIHTLKLQDWLVSRRLVPKNIQKSLKDIREKIANALQDMPEHKRLRELLTGTNINYYHCKEIVEILKQTEKDTKSVFGTYGSQRMKDWQEVIKLYEKESIYLAEAAQLYVRNVNFEIPGMRKQMLKLEQQADECLKRVQDLNKPEAQFLAEHAALLQQLGVKGENLRKEFTEVLEKLPQLYQESIKNIGSLNESINLYAECSTHQELEDKSNYLPILRHLAEYGNTTVYQYIHKEAPLAIEEPVIKLNLMSEKTPSGDSIENNDIDFGDVDDNVGGGGGTSSTVSSGELIDFGDGNDIIELPTAADDGAVEIDWGIETRTTGDSNYDDNGVEINFDIPIEEYGIVVERVGMDGGTAKGEQAYTLLDAPQYRDRFLDELYELESFLLLRLYELKHMNASSNIMYSLLDSISTQDEASIQKMLNIVSGILLEAQNEQTRHLFQLKHSPKYADLLASKLKQMSNAVEKIRATKKVLKQRAVELKEQRQALNPVLEELIAQTKQLQNYIEADISKRYKNRPVNLLGGVV